MLLNMIKFGVMVLGAVLCLLVQAEGPQVVEGESFAVLYQKGAKSELDAKTIARDLNVSVSDSIPDIGVYVFKGAAGENITEIIKNHPLVKNANDHHYIKPALSPNDPDYVNSNVRQAGLKKIEPESAWDRGLGEGVVVAVLDTGVEFNHEDLYANILDGYDFIDNRPITSGAVDLHGHGTHIAGIIAGVMNNGIGITGVAPKAKILPVRVLNEYKQTRVNTQGTTALSSIKGIQYAAKYATDNDVNVVINTSFGAPSEQNYCDSINDVLNDKVVIVAAAMNQGRSDKYYPAACDRVIAVANVDANDVRVPDSNYGNWIHISAPGQHVYSTWKSNSYTSSSGTSMATGLVSGAIAVLLSANKEILPKDIEPFITNENSVDPVQGSDASLMGAGRLNLRKAMEALPVVEKPQEPSPPKTPGNFSIQLSD